MSDRDPAHNQSPAPSEPGQRRNSVDPGERERLTFALGERFAPHLQAAAAAVRHAEQDLEAARADLARAREEAANRPYQSNRLVFVRQAAEDEAEALTRKTTPKAVRTAYRYLLDRTVELAGAEVDGYHSDEEERQRERTQGVDACLAAQERAAERLELARATQQRVHDAEQAARQGLADMIEMLNGS